MYGLAQGGTYTATIDAYAPTAQDNVAASRTKQERSRSVAVTNIAPKSAAQSGIGNGPAAIASGEGDGKYLKTCCIAVGSAAAGLHCFSLCLLLVGVQDCVLQVACFTDMNCVCFQHVLRKQFFNLV
jgi:hypothetical protein